MFSIRTLLKYGSVNAVLLPLNLGTAWFLTELGMHYLAATVIGCAIQITGAFFMNRSWTFARPEVRTVSGILRASLVEVSAFGVILGTAAFAVEVMHLDYFWARILAVLTSGAWCYVLDTHFTFRVRRERT